MAPHCAPRAPYTTTLPILTHNGTSTHAAPRRWFTHTTPLHTRAARACATRTIGSAYPSASAIRPSWRAVGASALRRSGWRTRQDVHYGRLFSSSTHGLPPYGYSPRPATLRWAVAPYLLPPNSDLLTAVWRQLTPHWQRRAWRRRTARACAYRARNAAGGGAGGVPTPKGALPLHTAAGAPGPLRLPRHVNIGGTHDGDDWFC